jgi:hypothetical protein
MYIVSTVQPYVDYVLDTLVLILSCLPSHRVFSTLFIFLTLLIKSDRHRQMRCAPVFFSHNRDSSYIFLSLCAPIFFPILINLFPFSHCLYSCAVGCFALSFLSPLFG